MKDLKVYNSILLEDAKMVVDREGSNKITGFASVDRPWNKHYRKTPIKDIKTNQTIYQMVFDQDDMNLPALGFLGLELTYKKLKRYVDQFASALQKNNIGKGDVVLMGISNSVGMLISLLAINKIGAISKWFDIRASEKDLEHYANSSNCKCMISFDMLLPKVNNIINNTSLEKVLVINPTDFLPKYKQLIYNGRCKKEGKYNPIPDDSRYISFNKFLKSGNIKSNVDIVSYDKDRPSIMIQSSGTTGKAKTIIHSDFSVISSVRQLAYSDLPFAKGKKILVALPPWIAYGLGNASIMALTFGTKVELSPDFEPNAVTSNIGKFTLAFAAPFHYRYLRDNFEKLSEKQLKDLEKVECMVTGGDKISIEENKEFEEKFGCPVVNGYGNNEGWGALTVNPTLCNKYGTVGIPKYDDIIISYNTEDKTENKYGCLGEICSKTDSAMLCYENNSQQTAKIKQMHDDGEMWIHTGDLGYIDEDGYVHLEGRASRVITRLGFKISAYTIEDKISEHYAVKECVTVSVKDIVEEHVPMSFIVLKDEYKLIPEKMKEEILQKCYLEMKENEIPKYIEVMNNLPYTPNNKYDFKLLEKMGNNYVDCLITKNNTLKKVKK